MQVLEERIKKSFDIEEVTVKRVGSLLCGENWHLAEKPFSLEFLNNVKYNSLRSMPCILWLQLNHLRNEGA